MGCGRAVGQGSIRGGLLLVERLHKRAKRVATDTDNTRAYERSVLTALLLSHTNALLGEGSAEFGLVGRPVDVPNHPEAVVARGCISRSVRMAAGDLVFRHNALGRISSCVMEGGALSLLAHEMRAVERFSSHSTVWMPVPDHCEVLRRANDVVPAMAWTKSLSANTLLLRM